MGSQLTDAKTRLADQEVEIKTANSKLQLSLSETENLKTSLTEKKKSWADEKTLLVQRAEAAEAALEEVTTELTGLKNCVSQMVSAIFGESFALVTYTLFLPGIETAYLTFVKILTGPRSNNLSQNSVTKLKAVYTLVEQLYTGAQ